MPCSSIEAEYRAVVNATIELIWVQYFLIEFGISQDHPPGLWCHNIGDTYLLSNLYSMPERKHIEVDYHFVRKHIA
jgi:hypothetical protein